MARDEVGEEVGAAQEDDECDLLMLSPSPPQTPTHLKLP